jgi:hypothetical protein
VARVVRAVFSLLLIMGGSILLPVTPAHAGVLDATCAGSEFIAYTPALTNVGQTVDVTVSTSFAPCVSLSTPGLTSGTGFLTATLTDHQCLDLLRAGPFTRNVTWNTGQTSTLSGNGVPSIVGASLVVLFTGSVTAGLFAGDTFVNTIVAPATDITLCTLGLGTVPSLFGVVTLEITSV